MSRRPVLVLLLLPFLATLLVVRGSLAQGSRFVPQTGFSIHEPFLSFWLAGGLNLYGYPISAELQELNPDDGQVYTVQYFERVRLELHPAAAQPIQIGRLGALIVARDVLKGKQLVQPADPSCITFNETSWTLCHEFAALWRNQGGLSTFGLPLTPPFSQDTPDGSQQVVQYTERARLELDPASGAIGLGLLGRESYRPAVDAPPAQPGDPVALRVVELINQERVTAGLEPVIIAAELTSAAIAHSQGMAASGMISHTGADGRDAAQRMHDFGYGWSRCGENIAVSYATPEEAMAFWMSSPPHRANILDPGLREVGVGHHWQPGGWNHYWTVDLGVR